jgi:hypothetical protein
MMRETSTVVRSSRCRCCARDPVFQARLSAARDPSRRRPRCRRISTRDSGSRGNWLQFRSARRGGDPADTRRARRSSPAPEVGESLELLALLRGEWRAAVRIEGQSRVRTGSRMARTWWRSARRSTGYPSCAGHACEEPHLAGEHDMGVPRHVNQHPARESRGAVALSGTGRSLTLKRLSSTSTASPGTAITRLIVA